MGLPVRQFRREQFQRQFQIVVTFSPEIAVWLLRLAWVRFRVLGRRPVSSQIYIHTVQLKRALCGAKATMGNMEQQRGTSQQLVPRNKAHAIGPPQVGWVGGKKEACTQTATFNVQLDEDVWVQQQAFNENAAKRTIKTATFKAQLGQDERRVPNL